METGHRGTGRVQGARERYEGSRGFRNVGAGVIGGSRDGYNGRCRGNREFRVGVIYWFFAKKEKGHPLPDYQRGHALRATHYRVQGVRGVQVEVGMERVQGVMGENRVLVSGLSGA